MKNEPPPFRDENELFSTTWFQLRNDSDLDDPAKVYSLMRSIQKSFNKLMKKKKNRCRGLGFMHGLGTEKNQYCNSFACPSCWHRQMSHFLDGCHCSRKFKFYTIRTVTANWDKPKLPKKVREKFLDKNRKHALIGYTVNLGRGYQDCKAIRDELSTSGKGEKALFSADSNYPADLEIIGVFGYEKEPPEFGERDEDSNISYYPIKTKEGEFCIDELQCGNIEEVLALLHEMITHPYVYRRSDFYSNTLVKRVFRPRRGPMGKSFVRVGSLTKVGSRPYRQKQSEKKAELAKAKAVMDRRRLFQTWMRNQFRYQEEKRLSGLRSQSAYP